MLTVALFYGGRSYEHEISILTAIQTGTFFPDGYKVIPVYMKDGLLYIKKNFRSFSSYINDTKDKKAIFTKGGLKIGKKFATVDCALIATHGGEGEDGTLSALLEYYSIPYTSCDMASSHICMDKALTKERLRCLGFDVVEEWSGKDYPCIIKPTVLGSSIGISIVNDKETLEKGKENAKYFGSYIIEPFLKDSIELNCAVVLKDGIPIPSEVEKPLHKGEYLDFDDKYRNGEREIPAKISDELRNRIQKTSVEIYQKLGLFGVVRIDYLLSGEKLYVNEINTIPGSLSYYLFSATGLDFAKLLTVLIEEGIKRGTKPRPIYGTEIIQDYANGFKGSKSK